jgi:hypothetical protein
MPCLRLALQAVWSIGRQMFDGVSRNFVGLSSFAAKRLSAIERSNRHRARKAGCEAETVDFIAVLKAQGWICGLCGLPMDPALKPPDRKSISLGHEPALSCGGAHIASKIEGQHLGCNLDKGRAQDTGLAAKIKRQRRETGPQSEHRMAKKRKLQSGRFLTNRDCKFRQKVRGKAEKRLLA